MLLGEHAVVYGRPCLVTAVDIRYQVTAGEKTGEYIYIESSVADRASDPYKINVVDLLESKQEFPKEVRFVTAAIFQVYKKHKLNAGLYIKTSGPTTSFGLGSSSAVTVSTVAALDALFNLELSQQDIFELSYAAVLDIQGKGSGFDVAAAVFGGTLYYVMAGKVIESLEIDQLPIVIGYTGEKVGTVSLIKEVELERKRLLEKAGFDLEFVYDSIEKLVNTARICILDKNWVDLGELININQSLLRILSPKVSPQRLEIPINAALEAGALGAKLSGAGGGDCMFALTTTQARDNLSRAIERSGAEIVNIMPNAKGVTLI